MAPKLDAASDEERLERLKHDNTYGITSDPLTQFSVVLSALVHDGTCSFNIQVIFHVMLIDWSLTRYLLHFIP